MLWLRRKIEENIQDRIAPSEMAQIDLIRYKIYIVIR